MEKRSPTFPPQRPFPLPRRFESCAGAYLLRTGKKLSQEVAQPPLEAIILAGGLGTRLAQTVPHLPKTLAPIQGVPFLHLILAQLARTGLVSKVILALGYRSDPILTSLQSIQFPFKLAYSIESTPLGTGGALLLALQKTAAKNILVLNGDSFFDLPFGAFLSSHIKKRAELTLACRSVEDTSRYGSIQLNADQKIRSYMEKAAGKGFISAGIYLIKKEILSPCPLKACSIEHDLFPLLVLRHEAYAYCHDGVFIDIGTPDSYLTAQETLKPWIES